MENTVLVTGGAGFIGSHLSEAYLNEGYKVVIVDNLSSGSIENISGIIGNERLTLCKVDIRDRERLQEVFEYHKPNIVNHHAAQKSVSYSVDNPLYDLDVNGKGLLNLLKISGKYNVKNFIYVSSGGALSKEISDNETSSETDMPQLMSPYAINKFSGEKYLEIYSKLYGFEYTILRYANVYGPRQIADGECGVIPIFVNNILAGKDSILMTYEDMPRGCTRDYVYVSDVITANMLSTIKPINTVINIGSGKEEYILDIYFMIQKVFNSKCNIEIKGPRIGDVRRSVLNISRASELLGWEQKINLQKGIELLKEYIKRNL